MAVNPKNRLDADRRLQDFLDASSDWFWEMDENCRFTYFSEDFTEITGVPQESLLGKTRQETGIPNVAPQLWEKHLADLAAHRSFREFVHSRTLPNGQVKYLSINGKALFDDSGHFCGYRGTGTDVTARVLAEQARERVSALFERAVKLANLGHWVWDEVNDRCIYCSEELARIHGITVDEYLRRTQSTEDRIQRLHSNDRERYHLTINKAIESGTGFEIEYRIVRDDDKVVYVKEVMEVEFDDNGRFVRSVGFIQDISEAVEARDALQISFDQLEQRVKERTAELRELYESLRVKESHLRQAQKMNRIGGFIWDDINNKPYEISQEFADLFKVTIPQALDTFATREKIEDLILPEDRESYRTKLETAKAQKTAYDVLFRSQDANGKLHYWRETGEPVVDDSGKLIRTFGTMQNLTKYKFTEEALKESEALLQQAHRISQIGFWSSNSDESLTVSSEMAHVLRVPHKEINGISTAEFVQRFVYDKDRKRVQKFFDSIQDQRQRFEIEYRVVAGDGSIRWVRELGEWITNEVTGLPIEIGTVQDVTEQKRSEQALKQSESRVRSLIENSPSAIVLEDESGEFILVNSRFQEWFDHPGSKTLGKTAYDVFPKEIANRYVSHNRQIIESELPSHLEFICPVNNEERIFHATKFPIPVTNGNVSVGAVIADVTERRQTERQLRHSQKMQAVGHLTGGVAHDFNNLLAVILGSAELLEQDITADDKKAKKLIQSIIHSSTKGAELTQRLLSFSRQLPLHPADTDLCELIGGMKDLLTRSLGEQYKVDMTLDPDTWLAKVDASQLENAIVNLAINAGHAMPNGGNLHIETYNKTMDEQDVMARGEVIPGDYAVIMVTDTGTGMTSDVLAQAIDPFFTTKEVGEGSGLGLSMVYGFAKQSGGELSIYSEPGLGTTVRLYLPRVKLQEETEDEAQIEEELQPGHETILVIEDNEDVRDMIEIMLEDLGYRVKLAEHAQAGREILKSGAHIDLLLSDVVLPGDTSGPEFVAQIKKDYPDLKVLYMSGYAESMKYQHNMITEDVELINKPFRKQEIADRLRSMFDV